MRAAAAASRKHPSTVSAWRATLGSMLKPAPAQLLGCAFACIFTVLAEAASASQGPLVFGPSPTLLHVIYRFSVQSGSGSQPSSLVVNYEDDYHVLLSVVGDPAHQIIRADRRDDGELTVSVPHSNALESLLRLYNRLALVSATARLVPVGESKAVSIVPESSDRAVAGLFTVKQIDPRTVEVDVAAQGDAGQASSAGGLTSSFGPPRTVTVALHMILRFVNGVFGSAESSEKTLSQTGSEPSSVGQERLWSVESVSR